MVYLHESEHLAVDYLDRLWLFRFDAGEFWILDGEIEDLPLYLGFIDRDPPWPRYLGPEPNWWITELGTLVDAWNDSKRFARDYRNEVRDAYHRAKGAKQ